MATIPVPFNKRIRITSQPHPKGGSSIKMSDAETGEPLPGGIRSITIHIEPDDIVVAEIAYGNSAFPGILRCPVTSIDATISSEQLPLWSIKQITEGHSGKD